MATLTEAGGSGKKILITNQQRPREDIFLSFRNLQSASSISEGESLLPLYKTDCIPAVALSRHHPSQCELLRCLWPEIKKMIEQKIKGLPDDELLKVAEVARFFRVSAQTIYLWCDIGVLEACNPRGGTLRILRKSVIDRVKKSLK